MKKTAVVLIIAGGLILIGIALIVAGFASADKWGGKLPKTERNSVSLEITEDFDELRIEETSCDIIVMASDDGKCRVESWETESSRLVAEVLNGSLYIERENHWEWKNFFSDNSGLSGNRTVVYLPKDIYKKAELKTTSGDIRVAEGLEFGSVMLHSTSGVLDICGITAEETDASVTSGSILVRDTAAGRLTAHSTSGEMIFANVSCETLKIDTTSGEIALDNVSAAISADLKATSADIEFDRLKCEQINIKTTSGDIEGSVVGTMLGYYPKTTSGDISVPNTTDGANGSCTAEATSGDIRITEVNE